ncbi:MAG: hypothetical protein IJ461_06925 [Clostridia bacterium]|nr:hypothetical protein [Clostridia bacterium]
MKEKLKSSLGQGGVSFLLAAGLVFPCLFTLGLESHWPWALGVTAAVTLLCVALSLNKWAAIIVPGAVILWQLAQWLMMGSGAVPLLLEAGRAILLKFSGQAAALPLYSLEITLLLSVLFALMAYPLCSRAAGIYPTMTLCLAVLVILWLTGKQALLWYAAPALIALVALYARSHHEDLKFKTLLPPLGGAGGPGPFADPLPGPGV